MYASTDIIIMIKLRRMGWAGHVVCMGKVKLSLCLTKHHAMKSHWVNGGRDEKCIISRHAVLHSVRRM
jgi:hypothetical protein